MTEDGQVDAVLVQERLECGLAGTTAVVASSRGVPRAVTTDDEPGGDGAVDRSQVSLEEFQLLVCGAEGATVQAC